MPRTELHEKLLSGPPDIAEPGDLYGNAARAAVSVLAENWAEALRDGVSLESMEHDVDDTIAILKEWRAHVLALAKSGDLPLPAPS
jgi:hypothetical protein